MGAEPWHSYYSALEEEKRRDHGSPIADERRPVNPLKGFSVAEVMEKVAAMGPMGYLFAPLWPEDAYGVMGAEDKAGKTWAQLDMAVSVAAGVPVFGHFPTERPGPVCVFLGEGGERNTVRRLDAIARSKGLELAALDNLRLYFQVPRLKEPAHLDQIARELADHPARLVVIDPLYLAAGGASGASLYEMGQVFYEVQGIVQEAGAALVVVTHFNKTGQGAGPERFTGVGPGAWGRVLAAAAIERRSQSEDGTSDVTLAWTFRGSEIPDTRFRVRRQVRSHNPGDLSSPMDYEVHVTISKDDSDDSALSKSESRVYAVLGDPTEPKTANTIQDAVATDGQGRPLRLRTVQTCLQALISLGMVDSAEAGGEAGKAWRSIMYWRTDG